MLYTSKVDTVPPVFLFYQFTCSCLCGVFDHFGRVRSQGKNPEQIPGNLYNSALYKHVSLSSPKVVQRERNPKNTYNTHLRSGL